MQDEFALRSQQLADAAYKESTCKKEELVPVPLKNSKGEATGESLTEDDHRRPQTTLEGFAKLKPAFGKNGTVTAGNASGIVDGGAAVVIMSLDEAGKRSIRPLGRVMSWGIAGVDPKVMGRGPVPATKIALQKARASFWTTSISSRSTKPSPPNIWSRKRTRPRSRKSLMSTAARLRWDIRWARPARGWWWCPCYTNSAAGRRSTVWRRRASAAGRGLRWWWRVKNQGIYDYSNKL